MPGPRKWLILAESRDLFFLEAETLDSIFQWDVMRQNKSYDDMFQAVRALTVKKSQNKNIE